VFNNMYAISMCTNNYLFILKFNVAMYTLTVWCECVTVKIRLTNQPHVFCRFPTSDLCMLRSNRIKLIQNELFKIRFYT